MATQLRITWDGETPGLSKGRLSLVEFGPALVALMKATRNIAAAYAATKVGEKLDPDTYRDVIEQIEMLDGAGHDYDLAAVRAGAHSAARSRSASQPTVCSRR